MGTMQKYDYGTLDLDEVEAEAAEIARQQGNQAFLQMKEPGKYFLRFLPPPKGSSKMWQVTHQHFVKLPGQERSSSFNCPRVLTQGARYCPACDMWERLSRSGNPVDAKRATDYKPKVRAFANVVNTKHPEDGVKVFAFGTMILDKLVKMLQDDRDAGQPYYCDPNTGRSIIVEKTGSGMDTKYDVRATHNSGPLADMDWLDQMHALKQYADAPSHEALARATGVNQEELEERDGANPAPTDRQLPAKKAAANAGVANAKRAAAPAASSGGVRRPPKRTVEDEAFEDPVPDAEVDDE